MRANLLMITSIFGWEMAEGQGLVIFVSYCRQVRGGSLLLQVVAYRQTYNSEEEGECG